MNIEKNRGWLLFSLNMQSEGSFHFNVSLKKKQPGKKNFTLAFGSDFCFGWNSFE